jgi:hypothetical protein
MELQPIKSVFIYEGKSGALPQERMGAARKTLPTENRFLINLRKDNKSGDFDSTETKIAVQ